MYTEDLLINNSLLEPNGGQAESFEYENTRKDDYDSLENDSEINHERPGTRKCFYSRHFKAQRLIHFESLLNPFTSISIS